MPHQNACASSSRHLTLWWTNSSPTMWLTLFVRSSHHRFHLLLHWATSLQIRLHPETSCRHWESKFLARVLKSCKSMKVQEGGQQKDLEKKKKHTAPSLQKNSTLSEWRFLISCFPSVSPIVLDVKSPCDTMLMWFVCKITAGFWFAWIESGKIYQTTLLAPGLCSPKHVAHPYFTTLDREPRHSADNSSGGFDHKNLHHR